MSDGYQVVMADLLSLSETFGSEATTCKAIMPQDGPVCPDGGDESVNGVLHGVTELIGLATLQLSAVMAAHGTKLQAAYDTYSTTETDLTQLSTDLAARAGLG